MSRVRTPNPVLRAHVARRRGAAFTLLELLVVMGILLVLATLTAISVGKVTRDAKLANATNTLIASLGNARAIAIRDNTYVLVSFRIAPDRRSRIVPREPQVVQVITSKWTGEVVTESTPMPSVPPISPPRRRLPDDVFADRYLPVPGVPVRELPFGILVAGPAFGFVTNASVGVNDSQWRTQPIFAGVSNFAVNPPTFAPNLAQGELGWAIGVMFGPDGRVLSRNPDQVVEVVTTSGGNQNAYTKGFVDFDGDGYPYSGSTQAFSGGVANVDFFIYDEPADEPLIDCVPFLAVFNAAEARERFPVSVDSWRGAASTQTIGTSGNPPARIRDQSLFIEEQSDRIVFNRYTGVPGLLQK